MERHCTGLCDAKLGAQDSERQLLKVLVQNERRTTPSSANEVRGNAFVESFLSSTPLTQLRPPLVATSSSLWQRNGDERVELLHFAE